MEFKTKNGRVVFDGKGLAPDIKTTFDTYPPVVISLLSKDLIFDYVTKYYYTHDTIKSAQEFKFTEFDDFLLWMKDKDYSYQIRSEVALQKFKKAIAEDTLVNFENEIVAFQDRIDKEKKSDLQASKDWIVREIEREIVGRYYYDKGTIESSFDDDVDIEQALDVLADQKKYHKILGLK